MKAIVWLCGPCAASMRRRRDELLGMFRVLSESHASILESRQMTFTEDEATRQAILEVHNPFCPNCRPEKMEGDA